MRDLENLNETFLNAKNPQARLRAALKLFCASDALSEAPARYLRMRSFAAALALIQQGDFAALRRFRPLLDQTALHRLLAERTDVTAEARAILLDISPSPALPGDADPIAALLRLWLNRLGMSHPSLLRVLCSLRLTPAMQEAPIAVDGERLLYDPARFTADYAARHGYEDCAAQILDYLHSERRLKSPPKNAVLWQLAAEGVGESYGRTHFGHAPGSREERLEIRKEAAHDFSGYLRRFFEIREERRLDLDSIDYIPYHYGMEHYRNLALIEPLEYQEAAKVREMVIAIDTSGSCTAEHVSRFLAEIRGILAHRTDFFREMDVYILQCDACIQDVRHITSAGEWLDYENRITIRGRGGTDFTPVFDWICARQREGLLRNLKSLLYFTDGDGIFPKAAPRFETALISPGRKILNYPTPAWCRIFCLEEKEQII